MQASHRTVFTASAERAPAWSPIAPNRDPLSCNVPYVALRTSVTKHAVSGKRTEDDAEAMPTATMLVLCLCTAVSALTLTPSQPLARPALARSGLVVASSTGEKISKLSNDELMDDFGGCLSGEPLGWKGAALATAATYLWYLGTNTQTNAERQAVEGPGVRRRSILLVVLLQVGAANFRSGTGKVCTDEERKDLVKRKLERKGFDTDKLSF